MAFTDTPPEPNRPAGFTLRKLLPFTTAAMIVAALYVAWTFYSRHQSDLEAQRTAAAKEQEQRERTVKAVFGSGEIRFSTFSADSSSLKRGDHTQLCYGVENAKTVTLDPPVVPLQPSYRSCVEIAPKQTTTYKITAEDGKGHSQTQSLTIQVQ